MWSVLIEKKIIHIHYYDQYEIYNFGRLSVIITIYLVYLISAWESREKDFEKKIMHVHYMTYMATPEHKNPYPRGHEIYNFGRPFLGHHYYILSLFALCLRVERRFLKE